MIDRVIGGSISNQHSCLWMRVREAGQCWDGGARIASVRPKCRKLASPKQSIGQTLSMMLRTISTPVWAERSRANLTTPITNHEGEGSMNLVYHSIARERLTAASAA